MRRTVQNLAAFVGAFHFNHEAHSNPSRVSSFQSPTNSATVTFSHLIRCYSCRPKLNVIWLHRVFIEGNTPWYVIFVLNYRNTSSYLWWSLTFAPTYLCLQWIYSVSLLKSQWPQLKKCKFLEISLHLSNFLHIQCLQYITYTIILYDEQSPWKSQYW